MKTKFEFNKEDKEYVKLVATIENVHSFIFDLQRNFNKSMTRKLESMEFETEEQFDQAIVGFDIAMNGIRELMEDHELPVLH